MAHLACPCGNSLSNSCDGDETEYYFVEKEVIGAHRDGFAFFELEYNGLSIEIWKCDVCDRMMFFDDPSAPVSRYMRRIDAESLSKDELAREHKSGICFNNLLFNEVDWFVGSKHKSNGEPDYEILGNPGEPDRGPLFTCRMMEDRYSVTRTEGSATGGMRTCTTTSSYSTRPSRTEIRMRPR